MDGRQFDDLTRKLATGTSRRALLRGLLVGTAAVATTAVLDDDNVAAQPGCRGEGHPCEGVGNECCSGLVCVGGDAPGQGPGPGDPGPGPGHAARCAVADNGGTTRPPNVETTPPPNVGTTPPPDSRGTTPPPSGGTSGEVTTIAVLPDTGAGDRTDQAQGWMGAAMAGGAAVLAARVLRRKPGEKSQDA
jgi:hypothetical protein